MKMKLALAVCAVLGWSAFAASLPSGWKYFQTVHVDRTGLIKMRVPLETIDAARPDLADIRLYDDAGREVPFRLELPLAPERIERPVRDFRVALSDNRTIVAFQSGLTQAIDRITIETASVEFIKAVTVEASNDGQTWQTVVRDQPIFRRGGMSRLYVDFAPAAWSMWRLSIDDSRSEAIPLTGATVRAAEPTTLPADPIDLKITDREDGTDQTRLVLRIAGAHVTLAGIDIDATDPLFAREASLAWRDYVEGEVLEKVLSRETIYRVALEGQTAVANLRVGAGVTVPARELILTIHNGDSPPLQINNVRALWRPVHTSWLVNRAGTFHFLSGNPGCTAPRYDLESLWPRLNVELVEARSVAALMTNLAFRASEPLQELSDVGSTIDLRKWKYRKRVEIAKPGVQQLELDLETLSAASPRFDDLRLVRDGRQVPYLLERVPITRTITPAVERADDRKQPTVSRWRIRLPHRGLPVTTLSAETDTPFFRREVVVLEQVPDERGDLRTVRRGNGTWTRALGDRKDRLVLGLSQPIGDTLILEIENGDNPPLELKNIAAAYPVTRLIFKSNATTPLFLYYGNQETGRPRYDIDLVALQMIAAEKSKAELGTAEQLRKRVWSDSGDLSVKAGWVFWIVLGGVVVALLFVIARLLPSKQQS